MAIAQRSFVARTKFDGAALKMAMQFHRMSYRELALKAGVSKSIVGFLVTGYRKNCNPETAAAIARGLGMSTNELFDLELSHIEKTNGRAA